ncbi:MAG: F0F1 ATP synthase subunit A [Proteobacteria bacterium]|nr:F0F1 ATP synthase subunit A [Pseudomonadota bacterium]
MAGGLEHPLIFFRELNMMLGANPADPGPGVIHSAMDWPIPTHTWFMILAILILFVISMLARRKLTLVPSGLQNVFEVIIGGLEDFVVTNIGEEGRKVYSLLITLFIFILTMNYLGLVPGCDAPTANVNTNAAMAIILFTYYNYIGIRKWGFGYIKHFMGPMLPLVILMFPLEIISHCARPLSLTLRLLGNIRGEEIVLLLLFALAPVVSTLPMYFLFILAKTIQAFIFFMLGMIYLKGALEHAH